MIKIAFRNIFRHKVRSLITLSSIIFGCVALIFVAGFFDNIFWQMRTTTIKSNTGHLQIHKKGYAQYGNSDPYGYYIDDLKSVEEVLRQQPEIDYVAQRIGFSALLSTGDTTVSVFGQGVDPAFEKVLLSKDITDLKALYKNPSMGLPIVEDGVGLEADADKEALLGRGLAQTMQVKPGITITLLAHTVNGSINAMDIQTKGIFCTFVKSFDDIFVRIPLKTAQRLLGTDSVESLVVYLHHTDDTQRVKERLEGIFTQKHVDVEITRWEDVTDFYRKTVELFSSFNFILEVVIIMVVVLGVFNTINMGVMERISEIGTLMAMGLRKKDIRNMFMLEGAVLGAVGGFLGIILGGVVVSGIAYVGIYMPPAPGGTIPWLSQPTIVPNALFQALLISIITGAIGALYPAYRASKLMIVEALRHR